MADKMKLNTQPRGRILPEGETNSRQIRPTRRLEPLMMTRDEVATELQVSTKTVDNLWREGKLPRPSRIGRGVRFVRREIMQFIADAKL